MTIVGLEQSHAGESRNDYTTKSICLYVRPCLGVAVYDWFVHRFALNRKMSAGKRSIYLFFTIKILIGQSFYKSADTILRIYTSCQASSSPTVTFQFLQYLF